MESEILMTVSQLPDALKQEVLHYAEFLAEKHKKTLNSENPEKKRRAGILKGTFVLPLPDDFDEPLEEFKDYM